MPNKEKEQKISIRKRQTLREAIPSWFLLITFVLMALLFYVLNPRILSARSVESVLATAALQGIISLGMMMVMTTGVFDLSLGMKAALAASVAGYICKDYCDPTMLTLGIVAGILAAGVVGLIHGFLNVNVGIPGFISALALRMLLQGVVAVLTQNTQFYSYEWGETFKFLGQTAIAGIPLPFIIFVVLAIVCWLFMERTKTGRHVYATGANATAAKQVGIRVEKMKYLSLILGAMVAAIGGILFASRNFFISVDIGLNLQMPAMTSCLIGAAFYQPGKYNVPGCMLGAIFLSLLTTGIFSVVISSTWLNQVLQGVVFLVALGVIAKTKEGGLSKVVFDL